MKKRTAIITSVLWGIAITAIALVFAGNMLMPPGLKRLLNNNPSEAVIEFHENTKRVPADLEELIEFCATEQIRFDASPYKEMSFRSDTKRIYIDYTTHAGSEGNIEFLKELFDSEGIEQSPSEYDKYENLSEEMRTLISRYYQENQTPPKNLIDIQSSALDVGITQLKSFSMKKKLWGGYKVKFEIRSDEIPPRHQLLVSFNMTKNELQK